MKSLEIAAKLLFFLFLAAGLSGVSSFTLDFQGAGQYVDMARLMGIIGQWKQGSLQTSDLLYYIGLWKTAEVVRACVDQTGFECQAAEHCPGNSLTALDTARCCDVQCQQIPSCDITNAYWEIT